MGVACYLVINNTVAIPCLVVSRKVCLLSSNNEKSSFQWICLVLYTFLSKCLPAYLGQCSKYVLLIRSTGCRYY